MALQSVKVDEAKGTITIVMGLEETESKSGKSVVIASTRGNVKTNHTVKGKEVTIGVNAYVPK